MENYKLKDVDGKTLWVINMDMNENYVQFMEDTWPLALEKVKALAEKS